MWTQLKSWVSRALNLNNPANWANLNVDDYEYPSHAGISVTAHAAMGLPTIAKGVNCIANDMAEMDWTPYRPVQGGKEALTQSRLHYLVNVAPNEYMTGFEFKRLLMKDKLLEGDGYFYIAKLNNGEIDSLHDLDANKVSPKMKDGRLVYDVYMNTGAGGGLDRKEIPADEIGHLRGLGDDLRGTGLVRQYKDELGLSIALLRYQAAFFKNAPNASGYIKHPGKLSAIAQDTLQTQFMRRHSGIENAHKPGVLCEGASWEPDSMVTPVDSAVSELREQEIVQHANMLLMPPHMLGSTKPTSYNSLEILQQDYVDSAISPHVVQACAELKAKLTPSDDTFWEMNTDKLLRATRKERYDAHKVAIEAGIQSRQEIRSLENLNNVKGADEFVISQNVKSLPEEKQGDVQKEALNGTQITSLLAIVQAVAAGQVAKESAKALISASFPTLTNEEINGIVNPLQIDKVVDATPTPIPDKPEQDGQPQD